MISVVYERWVTIDDGRACPECVAQAGKVYQRGEGPQPPLHPGCRCKRVYSSTVYIPTPYPEPGQGEDKEKELPE